MKKLILTKEIVEHVDQLGWNDYTQKEPSFQEKAKRALEGFYSSRWNSGYIKFIAENLEKIEVSNPLGIKSTLYGEEVKEYTSSIGNENYYFDPEGKFIEKKMYYKYK